MNQIIIKGNLTKDPELTYVGDNNTPKCAFTVAVKRKFSKEGKTDFIPCVSWQKTAEFVKNYFSKGKEILVSGRLELDSWKKDDGTWANRTNVVADNVEFCGSKSDSTGEDYHEVDDSDSGLPF